MVFPVVMYGCESWTVKRAEHQRLMLLNCDVGGDLESPLDCKEIQPVHPKGDQSWVFSGRTDVEAETPTLAIWCEALTHWKRPWCWERLKAAGEGDDRGWDGWMASPTQWTWVWVNSESWWWTGRQACCSPWGRKELDTTGQLTSYLIMAPTCKSSDSGNLEIF